MSDAKDTTLGNVISMGLLGAITGLVIAAFLDYTQPDTPVEWRHEDLGGQLERRRIDGGYIYCWYGRPVFVPDTAPVKEAQK